MIRAMPSRRTALAVALLLALPACKNGSPSATPTTAPPTTAPVVTTTPKPTKKPTKKPTPKPTPTKSSAPAIPPATGPAPAHFRPIDFSFVGAHVGWALGESCTDSACVAHVAYTTDSGGSWHALPDPKGGALAASEDSGDAVRQTRFGNLRNGYLFDPALYTTHDGGHTWKAVSLGGPVVALNEHKGTAWAVVRKCSGGSCQTSLWVSPMDHDAFVKRATIPLGGPPGNQYELVRNGPSVAWLSAVGDGGALLRTTNGGASWQSIADPCTGFEGGLSTQQVSNPGGNHLWLGCGQDAGAGSQDKALFHSTDAGTSWGPRKDPARTGLLIDLVGLSPTVGLLSSTHAGLLRTTDGGATWKQVATDCCDAGFGKIESIDGAHVWAIGFGANAIFASADSGRTWIQTTFTE